MKGKVTYKLVANAMARAVVLSDAAHMALAENEIERTEEQVRLWRVGRETLRLVAETMGDAFLEHNAEFDRASFVALCGVNEPEPAEPC